MTRKLEGMVAVVTGAGSKPSEKGAFGTGKAIALLFAREGAKIIVVDRHEDRAADTKRIIDEAGGECATVVTNIADQAVCRNVVEVAVARFGKLDILVHNAAVAHSSSLLEMTPEMLQESITVNFTVPFLLSQAAVPEMIRAGGGSIVNISSIAAVRGSPAIAYSATKGGVVAMMKSIATSYGKSGIRANSIAVGGVDTPLRRHTMSGEYKPRVAALPTEGDAWAIAQMALFLASADSSHVTAALIPVDGGAIAMLP